MLKLNIRAAFPGREYLAARIDLDRPFDEMADEHRTMIQLVLEGSDQEIEDGFKRAYHEFLQYVLVRFGELDKSAPELETEDPTPISVR